MDSKATLPDLRMREAIQDFIHQLAKERGVGVEDPWVAQELDRRDKLASFRSKFHIPTISEYLDEKDRAPDVDPSAKCAYFSGDSCGLQPKGAKELVDMEMTKWAHRGIQGHFTGEHPWLPVEDFLVEESARIVGAKPIEVAIMNTLSVNIHLGLVPFYQPTPERHRILMEERPFPSDLYAVQSQVRWHGYDPSTAIIFASLRKGEDVWRTEDIVKLIEEQGDSIALVFFSGVHFATGHLFDIKAITEAAHRKGCYAGFDLAHAAGNVELCLHDWEVDFANWCTYKYINSGPGGIGGFFIHEKHAYNQKLPRLLGWWSHKRESRLVMDNVLDLQPGAAGFQISNPPILPCMTLLSSLHVFKETSMAALCLKSRILTGYLELLLEDNLSSKAVAQKTKRGQGKYVSLITSGDPAKRGCQLSLRFSCPIKAVYSYLTQHGISVDLREPDIMRVAPAPLYNSFSDVLRFYQLLKQALEQD